MKRYSKKVFAILIAIQFLATILIAICPQVLIDYLYPISFFPLLFLLAIAFSDIPKLALVAIILLIAAFIISVIVFVFFLFVKKREIRPLAVILMVFFLGESLCYLLSLLNGSFAFGKIVGMFFNIMIVVILNQGQGDGSVVSSENSVKPK